MVVGTSVEGLGERKYIVGVVWNWIMVSWFLGKVGVVVMVVVVGSRMGEQGKGMGRGWGRAC